MSKDSKITLLDMIDSITRAETGDLVRLGEIRQRLVNGRPIYNSDKTYVSLIFEKLPADLQNKSEKAVNPKPESHRPPTKDTRNLYNKPNPKHESYQSPPSDHESTTQTNVDVSDSDSIAKKHDKNKEAQSSKAWYLLPIFLWLLGGLISYGCLRKDHPSRARKSLILGAGLSVPAIVIVIIAAVAVSASDVTSSDISRTNLSDEQIRQKAIFVPYESLLNNPEQHVGEMIHYDGQIIQLRAASGNNYDLRIKIMHEGIDSSDVIWSNYKADTDEKVQWMDRLLRSDTLFTIPNSDNTVTVFGISKGIKEYTNLFQGITTVPEIDVLIMEQNDVVDVDDDTGKQAIDDDLDLESTKQSKTITTYGDKSDEGKMPVSLAVGYIMAPTKSIDDPSRYAVVQ